MNYATEKAHVSYPAALDPAELVAEVGRPATRPRCPSRIPARTP